MKLKLNIEERVLRQMTGTLRLRLCPTLFPMSWKLIIVISFEFLSLRRKMLLKRLTFSRR